MRGAVAGLVVALAALAAAAPAAGIKTVKDWTGVCDNLGACSAFGFSPDDAATGAYLKIVRAAGPAAEPSVLIVFDTEDTAHDQSWTLLLDGAPIKGVGPIAAKGGDSGARGRLTGAQAAALIAALRNGQTLGVFAAGEEVSPISLAGSAAVLLWVDDQQGRVGGVTALSRKGPALAASVPGPRPVPLVAAAPVVSQAGLPEHAPKGLTKGIEDCDLRPGETPDDIVLRLSPGVVLWGPECSMAAYNEMTVFFVGDEHAAHLRRVAFPEAPGADQPSDAVLVNADVDAKTLTVSQFAKGRGIGDCGEAASWVWDGKAFRLLSEDVMPVCHGVVQEDWPHLFVGRRK